MTSPAPPRRPFVVPSRILVRLAAYFVVCWSVLVAIVHGVVPYAGWIVACAALYTTLPLFVFLRRVGWSSYPGGAFRVLVVRVLLYAQLALPFVTASACVGGAIGAVAGNALAGARAGIAAMASALGCLYLAGYVGSRRLRVVRLDVAIPTLPPSFSGVTIAQICDLHVGPQTTRRFLRRVRAILTDLAPDMIVIPGDLVDDRWEDVAIFAGAFRSLAAPLGVFVSPGNHEVYQGWAAMRRAIEGAGIGTLLVNESRIIARDGSRVAIVGTGDPAGRMVHEPDVAPDIDRALERVPSNTVVIALAHNPALWPALAARGVQLTLSGHTHWGQLASQRRRWNLAARFIEHSMGYYRSGGSQLYVSAGTGYWGIPFRIGAPSEVTLIRLRPGPAADGVLHSEPDRR